MSHFDRTNRLVLFEIPCHFPPPHPCGLRQKNLPCLLRQPSLYRFAPPHKCKTVVFRHFSGKWCIYNFTYIHINVHGSCVMAKKEDRSKPRPGSNVWTNVCLCSTPKVYASRNETCKLLQDCKMCPKSAKR